MALTQAQALAAGLVAIPWDAELLARAALAVTTALLAASPRVQWERGAAGDWDAIRNEGTWWVDAAGLGDEQLLAKKILAIARAQDAGPVHVGIADAAIAAYAATFRSPIARAPSRLTTLVPCGRDAAFLAPYPISLLDLGDDLKDTFAALGLTTVGQIAKLDSGEAESRFGPEGLAAHRLARGQDGRGPSTPRDDSLPEVSCDLGDPVSTAEPLLFVMKGALESLGRALRDKGLAAREIAIQLTLDDGSTASRTVRAARPTSHEGALFDHCRAALDDWPLEEPVTGIALRAAVTVPAAGEQGNLLKPRWADPSALEAAFDRIRGREGADAVAVPEACDGHLPADAGAWRLKNGGQGDRGTVGSKRPKRTSYVPIPRSPDPAIPRQAALRLLTAPLSVRVRLGRSGLEAFRVSDTWHDVSAWSGPEALTPRWWQHAGKPRSYFVACTVDGALWLLYCSAKQWFVEGWWD